MDETWRGIRRSGLFGFSILSSAFALFLVQPLMSKLILPWFGGGPWVWAVCLVFYQGMLLAGYLYSHIVSTRLSLSRQAVLHSLLLVLAVMVVVGHEWAWPLPLRPASGDYLQRGNPTATIFGLLGQGIGLPYVLLAAASPLLQAWYAASRGEAPYRLYALSNLGSLAGLLSYPLVFEPRLGVWGQTQLWVLLFLVAAGSTAATAWRLPRARVLPISARSAPAAQRLDAATALRWLAFSALPSALLVSTTTIITENVAAVPLLWVVPLALYLVTLIVAFGRESWYRPAVAHPALAFCVFAAAVALSPWRALLDAPHEIAIFAAALATAAYVCHAELVRARPLTGDVTAFYLVMALGGALGGASVALAAPALLPDFWEYHLCLFAICAALVLQLFSDPESWLRRHKDWLAPALLAGVFLFRGRLAFYFAMPRAVRINSVQLAALGAALVTTAYLALRDRRRDAAPRRYSLAQGLVVFVLAQLGLWLADDARASHHDVVARRRTFFGVLTVEDGVRDPPSEATRVMRHGVTTHGAQFLLPERRQEATSYYHRDTGVYRALEAARRAAPERALRLGVVGLGTGTLAAYADAGDSVQFYELDPSVIEFARRHFTFLSDTKGSLRITSGDARLALEDEASQGFDLLVLDAFNGDSLPVHLITREAFDVYRRHLRNPGSLVAVNISNRFLDLEPVVANLAEALHYGALVCPSTERDAGRHPVTWAVLSADPGALARVKARGDHPPRVDSSVPLWTDSFSDIFHVLRDWRVD